MKPHHIIGGIVGLIVLAVWAVIHMTVSFIFTGKAFPND